MLSNGCFSCLALVSVCSLVIGLLSTSVYADIFNSADFRISQSQHDSNKFHYVFSAQLPTSVINSTDVELPKGCLITGFDRQAFGSKTQLSYEFECTNSLPAIADSASDTPPIIATPWYLDGARLLLNIDNVNASVTLKRSLDTMLIPLTDTSEIRLTKAQTIKRYLWQGMLHIWFGWDHLAFVLCLCLLASAYRLLTLVTTFTLGHSLTLALSYYELVSIPIAPIEVLIAFSIMLMAKEALLTHKTKEATNSVDLSRTPLFAASAGVVLLFGLIHGLGFASALSELGVPQNEIGLALLFFNLGVEVGQIAFIAMLSGLSVLLKYSKFESFIRSTALYLVGVLGSFWVIERLVGFADIGVY